MSLFSVENNSYRKNMEKKINEPDEYAFFSAAVVLQYLQTCLLYKSQPNQCKMVDKVRQNFSNLASFETFFL